MSVHVSHAALPYPIKNARYSALVPGLDADGDPTLSTTPDTEVSKDNAAAADAAEEVSATSGMDGMALITFTGAETDCSTLGVNFKVASGPKATLMTLYPRVLAVVGSGTLSAGSVGGGTLGTLLAYDVTGCFLRTTGGTGGGGTGGANNQARKIVTYNTTTGAFTVVPNWETTPDATTTYDVLLPEGVTLGMLKALNPTTPGRMLNADTNGKAPATLATGDVTGNLPASLEALKGTALTEGAAGRLKAAFTTLFDVASPVFTAASVNQTGDSFGRIGANGASLTDLGGMSTAMKAQVNTEADTALSDAGVTGTRTGYLDKLNVTGNVASQTDVLNVSNNTLVRTSIPGSIERPDSGSETLTFAINLYDESGNMESPDSTPTLALVSQSGTDLSSRLSALSNPSTGRYTFTYTSSAADTLEELRWTLTVIEGGATRIYDYATLLVDTSAVDFTSADRNNLNALVTGVNVTTWKGATPADLTATNGYLQTALRRWLTDDATGTPNPLIGNRLDVSASVVSDKTGYGLTAGTLVSIGSTVWASGTRILTAGTNIVLAKGTGITGFNDITVADVATQVTTDHGSGSYVRNTEPLDAAGVRAAVGLAAANLDTQLDAVPTVAENADALLARNIAGGSNTGRTVKQALASLRNKVAFDVPGAGQFTVFDTDDVTPLWTGTYSTSPVDPVTAIDPA